MKLGTTAQCSDSGKKVRVVALARRAGIERSRRINGDYLDPTPTKPRSPMGCVRQS